MNTRTSAAFRPTATSLPHAQPTFRDDAVVHDVREAIGELTAMEWIKKVRFGLAQAKESGPYKFAHQQLIRLWSPVSGVLLTVAIVLALLCKPTDDSETPDNSPTITVIEPGNVTLDPIPLQPPDEPTTPLKPPPLLDPFPIGAPPLPDAASAAASPAVQPAAASPSAASPIAAGEIFDPIKSSIVFTLPCGGIGVIRTPQARRIALQQYGGKIAGRLTEDAVMRALRWLKKVQDADGKWTEGSGGIGGATQANGAPAAMTGLALLTFLAHDETPESEEFGPTVRKAIEWLVSVQLPDGGWTAARHYEHQIACYAIVEAYALTRIPALKEAATRGVEVIVRGQNAAGGWNYPLLATDTRSDTSVMAWCAQALKAAKMSRLANHGLDACLKRAIDGFRGQADPHGGFAYATTIPKTGTPVATPLTGAATLSMQFLGASRLKETRAGIQYLAENRTGMDWKTARWTDLYWWYYDTQARFQEGGEPWEKWNQVFAVELLKNQTLLKGEGADGKDVGYWKTSDDKHGLVLDTTLCTLQLEVYYRYLPTYRPPAADGTTTETDEGGVDVQVAL